MKNVFSLSVRYNGFSFVGSLLLDGMEIDRIERETEEEARIEEKFDNRK